MSTGSALRDRLDREARTVEMPAWFFDQAILSGLDDRGAVEIRRLIAAPPEGAWAILVDPGALPAWVSASRIRIFSSGPLRPGARIAARGHVADRRASLDRTIVTYAEPGRRLAWTTRARIPPLAGAIEFRWSIEIGERDGGCEARHRLRGVAFPAGVTGRALRRAYGRIEDGMGGSMHRGLERLAALIEGRAR